jgi:VWFA-related protein
MVKHGCTRPVASGWAQMAILKCVSVFGLLTSFSLAGQVTANSSGSQPGASSSASPRLISRSHLERERTYQIEHRIILNVQVTDASGKPATGWTAQDFTLLDAQRPRSDLAFKAVESPIPSAPAHVILVLDAVNNSARDIANDRRQLQKFPKQNEGPLAYLTSIATVSDSGLAVGKPSRDRAAVLGELTDMAANLQPINCADESNPNETFQTLIIPGAVTSVESSRQLNCLNQRFTESVTALSKLAERQVDVPGRVILIWIGPGWPHLYNPQFRHDDAALRRNLFSQLVYISTALREGQVTLSMICPPDFLRKTESLNDHDKALLNGLPKEADVTAGSLSLEAFAHQSGGQILIEKKNIPDSINACIADAASYYVFAFDAGAATGASEYHSLEVKVNRPGATVRTNTLYYAEP